MANNKFPVFRDPKAVTIRFVSGHFYNLGASAEEAIAKLEGYNHLQHAVVYTRNGSVRVESQSWNNFKEAIEQLYEGLIDPLSILCHRSDSASVVTLPLDVKEATKAVLKELEVTTTVALSSNYMRSTQIITESMRLTDIRELIKGYYEVANDQFKKALTK
jgi:hypothetical protein